MHLQFDNGAKCDVEIVSSPDKIRQGLMGRKSLAFDHGMLFMFDARHVHSVWMRNTLIPLDAAFLDIAIDRAAGHRFVVSALITGLTPMSDEIHQGDVSVAMLEMNHGWFESNRVGVGSRMTLVP